MKACIFVGLGGAAGAVCRYLFSMVPIRGSFPVMTLLTNLLGAVVIGCVVGGVSACPHLPDSLILFLKTGFCGGFTTFSTFSLETLTLWEDHKIAEGTVYAVLSVLFCIAGVFIGRLVTAFLIHRMMGME